MSRFLLSCAVIVGSVAVGNLSAGAEDEKNWEEVFIKEVQADGQAWQYSGVKLPAGYTATITAAGTWQINETWDKKVGAGGNSTYKAADSYVKVGANEGCLLVRIDDTVHAFSKDDETIRITGPGKIYFCANDLPTTEGLEKAALFVDGIPIQAAKDAQGSGYQDNEGVLKVRIAVSKAKKRGEEK
jgi:hypothetical protein